jgi:hypothetical protein
VVCSGTSDELAAVEATLGGSGRWIAGTNVSLVPLEESLAAVGVMDGSEGLSRFERMLQEALTAGCSGLRLLAFNTHLLRQGVSVDALLRWEYLAGRWQNGKPVDVLCAYQGRSDSPLPDSLWCLHPYSAGAPASLPFRLFPGNEALHLEGEVDRFSSPHLVQLLSLIHGAERASEMLLDAPWLSFSPSTGSTSPSPDTHGGFHHES